MTQLKGFEKPNSQKFVYKLNLEVIYELKQAQQVRNKKMDEFFEKKQLYVISI